jgi:hypothetical protein
VRPSAGSNGGGGRLVHPMKDNGFSLTFSSTKIQPKHCSGGPGNLLSRQFFFLFFIHILRNEFVLVYNFESLQCICIGTTPEAHVCLTRYADGRCDTSIQSRHVSRCDLCISCVISIDVTPTKNSVTPPFLSLPPLFPSSFSSLQLAAVSLVI